MALINDSLEEQANGLLRSCLQNYHALYGMGSMTISIYDTAWISMISKRTGDHQQWLFPESFHFILNHQDPSGGWCTELTEIDGILSTMAALLALRKHIESPLQLEKKTIDDASGKIPQAISFLQKTLHKWDVPGTNHVGFELLVPAMLEMLDQEGISFDFAGRRQLLQVRDEKLAKFKIEMLYSKIPNPAIHSLEAFIGKLDFDRMCHHKSFGSMMASPASTAAFLMQASKWDDESEAYIRHVLSAAEDGTRGGVPSAFPTSLFELTWVVTNLYQNGFSAASLDAASLSKIRDILQESFNANKGLIGFAPSLPSDADDTAKGIVALDMLGSGVSCERIIEVFEDAGHFKTYAFERNPSLTTNCNVLNALLHDRENMRHRASQIEKVVRFLCGYWCSNNGEILDKWNLSPLYPMMLMSQCLAHALKEWENVFADAVDLKTLKSKTHLVLVQILERTIQLRNNDASWGKHPREETAYAILTINNIAGLPILSHLAAPLQSILDSSRKILSEKANLSSEPEYLWIEKVTYGSCILSKSYILAALKCSSSNLTAKCPLQIPADDTTVQANFYSKLPLFANSSDLEVKASILEGTLFSATLRQDCAGIFPRKNMREEKYLRFIPFTWTGGNNVSNQALSADVCREMMTISALIYQADEFMESIVGSQPSRLLPQVVSGINNIFDAIDARQNAEPCQLNSEAALYLNGSTRLEDIIDILRTFVEFTVYHPHISGASEYDLWQLRLNLREFLLSHLTQVEDNHRLRAQKSLEEDATFQSPTGSFASWIRSTSANHTGGPFAFSFLLCLLSRDGKDYFSSVEAKFIAQDVSRHVSTMCRMYNDWGSIMRDRKEKNLNSINFPEFYRTGERTNTAVVDEAGVKKRLSQLFHYERQCLNLALAELKNVCSEQKAKQIQVFCDVTDLYGQMYVVKDLTPELKKRKQDIELVEDADLKKLKAL